MNYLPGSTMPETNTCIISRDTNFKNWKAQ